VSKYEEKSSNLGHLSGAAKVENLDPNPRTITVLDNGLRLTLGMVLEVSDAACFKYSQP